MRGSCTDISSQGQQDRKEDEEQTCMLTLPSPAFTAIEITLLARDFSRKPLRLSLLAPPAAFPCFPPSSANFTSKLGWCCPYYLIREIQIELEGFFLVFFIKLWCFCDPVPSAFPHMAFPVLGSSSWPLSGPFQPTCFSFACLKTLNNEPNIDPWGPPLVTGCQLGKDLKVLRFSAESKLWSVLLSDSGKKVDFFTGPQNIPSWEDRNVLCRSL